MVNFELLMALVKEAGEDSSIQDVIATLSMFDISMTEAVIDLGIAADVLVKGYHNKWSEESNN